LGDLNYNNGYDVSDVYDFESVLDAQGTQFNPAADLNGDGKVDDKDLFLLPSLYAAGSAVQSLAQQMVVQRGDLNNDGVTNAADINTLVSHYGSTAWTYDLDASGQPANFQDLLTLVRVIMKDVPGDALLSGRVNLTDLQIVGANWGRTNATWQQGNFTGTGPVGVADLQIVAENYGWTSADNAALPQEVSPIQTVGSPGIAGVGISLDQAAELAGIPLSDLTQTPEPGSLGIMGFAAAGLLGRRRRRASCGGHGR
jgi:alpha-amylase